MTKSTLNVFQLCHMLALLHDNNVTESLAGMQVSRPHLPSDFVHESMAI